MKKNVYVCITESLCCTAEINTTLYINYTSIKKIKNCLKKKPPKTQLPHVCGRLRSYQVVCIYIISFNSHSNRMQKRINIICTMEETDYNHLEQTAKITWLGNDQAGVRQSGYAHVTSRKSLSPPRTAPFLCSPAVLPKCMQTAWGWEQHRLVCTHWHLHTTQIRLCHLLIPWATAKQLHFPRICKKLF